MTIPLSFELAKLLKEKGFDRITNKSYRVSINPELFVTEPITDENTYFPNVKESYSAPTIAEVVMWLYEKYEIWISTHLSIYDDGFDVTIFKNKTEHGIKHPSVKISNPTEAYEAAIEYTLKNLI